MKICCVYAFFCWFVWDAYAAPLNTTIPKDGLGSEEMLEISRRFEKEMYSTKKEMKVMQEELTASRRQLKLLTSRLKEKNSNLPNAPTFRCESGTQNSPYLTTTYAQYETVHFATPFKSPPKVLVAARFAGDWNNARPIVINTWVQGKPLVGALVIGFQTANPSSNAFICSSWMACGV